MSDSVFAVYKNNKMLSIHKTLGHAKSSITNKLDNEYFRLYQSLFATMTPRPLEEDWKKEQRKEYSIVKFLPECIVDFQDIEL